MAKRLSSPELAQERRSLGDSGFDPAKLRFLPKERNLDVEQSAARRQKNKSRKQRRKLRPRRRHGMR